MVISFPRQGQVRRQVEATGHGRYPGRAGCSGVARAGQAEATGHGRYPGRAGCSGGARASQVKGFGLSRRTN